MPFVTRKSLFTLVVLAAIALSLAAGFVWSGVYNIGADDTHTRPVYAVLQALRERSIDARAGKLPVPTDLADPDRIQQGSGNYDAMCVGCHLAPGADETELSMGLYPQPPNLSRQPVDPARAFWVIKHGIKASGMPAWGKSMNDEYIWNMAAFLQKLPKLDAAQYRALVASSGGHSHGGGETGGGAPADKDDHHGQDASGEPPAKGDTHVHADGKKHVHAESKARKVEPKVSPEPMKAAAQDTSVKPAAEPATDEHSEHEHEH